MKRLSVSDPEVFEIIEKENERQDTTLNMIPSENYASPAVRAACGSILGNKYAEGYPKKDTIRETSTLMREKFSQ